MTSDPFMYKGLGTLNGTSVPNGKTPKFWPYVDGTIIKENPLSRGAQVPAIIGYSKHFHWHQSIKETANHILFESRPTRGNDGYPYQV